MMTYTAPAYAFLCRWWPKGLTARRPEYSSSSLSRRGNPLVDHVHFGSIDVQGRHFIVPGQQHRQGQPHIAQSGNCNRCTPRRPLAPFLGLPKRANIFCLYASTPCWIKGFTSQEVPLMAQAIFHEIEKVAQAVLPVPAAPKHDVGRPALDMGLGGCPQARSLRTPCSCRAR